MTTIKFVNIVRVNSEVATVVKATHPELFSKVYGNRDYYKFLAAVANGAAYCTIDTDDTDMPYKTNGIGNIALDNGYTTYPATYELHDQMYQAMQDGLSLDWANKNGLLMDTAPLQPIVFNIEAVEAVVSEYIAKVHEYNNELFDADKQCDYVKQYGKDNAIKRLTAEGSNIDYVHKF
ncbi:MAG: hypothetical protein ACRDAT_08080 [Cetobacterium sp.]